jgi:hypothetical protein
MKKTIFTIAYTAIIIASFSGCSSSQSTASSIENFAKQETEQLVITYLKQKLAAGHPQLAGVLSSATASTAMSSILGGNSSTTGALTGLVSSQFGVNQQGVTNQVTSSGSTLGSLASFLVQNTNASTLTSLVSKVK